MINHLTSIPLTETQLVPPIVKDYLNKDAFLNDFVSDWHHEDGIENLIKTKQFSEEKRNVLVKHLLSQYEKAGINLADNAKTFQNIQLLTSSNTYTITTGHQLSLFGGTLFMSYKILTAIKLAASLNAKKTDKKFVPILWLASEDHDFEEIKSTYLFGKTFSWEKDSASKATGQLSLNGIHEVIDQLRVALGSNQMAINWMAKIEEAYQKTHTLGEATLRFYHLLFEEFGLVILDPNSKELKSLFVDVMQKDILDQTTFSVQSISDKKLETRYKLQINARPINFFYLDENAVRSLIKINGNEFTTGDGVKNFKREEITAEILTFPERFSPNVNLRPIYQEAILPNLAYIGGPGEIAYWLQLKANFEAYAIQFPIPVLRFINLVLGSGLREKIEKTGLKYVDLIESEKVVSQKLIDQLHPINFNEKFESILNEMQILVDDLRPIDGKMSKEFLENKLKAKEFYKSKSAEIKKALSSNEQIQIDRVLKLRSRLFPNGVFQERIETLLQMELMFESPLLHELLELIQPFSGELAICED